MRILFAVAVSCVAAVGLLTVESGAQSRCPASATQASFSIWPAGTLINTRHSTARHSCGRTLQCIGGHSISGERRCTWL